MDTNILRQSFAVDKKGKIRSVEDIPRGLKCDCTCPCCGEQLIARQGEVREWHFAHNSGNECDSAAESALHLAAKQLLLESGGMMLPEIILSVTETLPDGRVGSGEAYRPEAWIDFQDVEAEKTFDKVRPDIVATFGDELLFIEIAVTHFVDTEKMEILEELGIPTIEINLDTMDHTEWNWNNLRRAVVDTAHQKYWIEVMHKDSLEQVARDAAIKAAQEQPLSKVSTHSFSKPPRTRFLVGGRIVDVIEHPFGVAIWSPYDPTLVITIKSLMRLLGGRWQPKFKSWLVPLEAKPDLLEQLGKLSGIHPEVLNR